MIRDLNNTKILVLSITEKRGLLSTAFSLNLWFSIRLMDDYSVGVWFLAFKESIELIMYSAGVVGTLEAKTFLR
jgi:hypothetical protein